MEPSWGRARGLGLWVGSPPLFAWFAGVRLGPVGRVSSLSLSVRWVGLPGSAPVGRARGLGLWVGSSSLPLLGPADRGGWLGACGLWG